MTAPITVKLSPSFFCWVTPVKVVGMGSGQRLWRDKDCKREWEKTEGVKGKKGRKRRIERGMGSLSQLMWKCLWSPRASPPPPHSVPLYLFRSFFPSFPLEFLSQRFTPMWRWFLIRDNNRDASVKAHTHTLGTNAHTSLKCLCKLKVALERGHFTHTQTRMNAVTHRVGLWVNTLHKT